MKVLQHNSQTQETKIYVENLIGSLDVEDNTRVKNNADKGNKGHSSTNMMQKNSHGKSKVKMSFNAKSITTLKKKNKT